MTRTKVLIADDDSKFLQECIQVLVASPSCYEMSAVESVADCVRLLSSERFDIVLLDINFTHGGREGIPLIGHIREHCPEASIIMLTSLDDKETIAECMNLGATDFISKSKCDAPSVIAGRLDKIAANRGLEVLRNIEAEKIAGEFGAVFQSESMNAVFREVVIARNNPGLHTLIQGPSGSGKELVARAIGQTSPDRKFIAINCACLSDNLIDSELFGHEKGAFTSAIKTKSGMFEEADGGDIFLDELARLSLQAQGKLLRVLQEGSFYRVGGSELIKTNVRVIAATNENLDQMVERGEFREDLLHRIKKFTIKIPPLRERKSDIEPLVRHFIKESPKPKVTIAGDLGTYLAEHSWPGNVRQLENTLDSLLARVADGACITIGDLPRQFFENHESKVNVEAPPDTFQFEIAEVIPIQEALDRFEHAYISWVARRLPGPLTVRNLARELGLSKSAMQRRLHALNIHFIPTVNGVICDD